jgi:hypothetical protein
MSTNLGLLIKLREKAPGVLPAVQVLFVETGYTFAHYPTPGSVPLNYAFYDQHLFEIESPEEMVKYVRRLSSATKKSYQVSTRLSHAD